MALSWFSYVNFDGGIELREGTEEDYEVLGEFLDVEDEWFFYPDLMREDPYSVQASQAIFVGLSYLNQGEGADGLEFLEKHIDRRTEDK